MLFSFSSALSLIWWRSNSGVLEMKRHTRPFLINIGFGNVVSAQRVIAIVSPDSLPMKRLREEAKKRGKLIDATEGRKTRSIIITDSDHIILSALQTDTIAQRFSGLSGEVTVPGGEVTDDPDTSPQRDEEAGL